MIEIGARSRIARQHYRPVVWTDAKMGAAQQQAVVTRAARISAAGEERMEIAVAGAAHRNVISARGEEAVKMRLAAVQSAIILGQQPMV